MDNLRRAILLFTVLLFLSTSIFGYVLALDYYEASGSLLKEVNYNGEKYNGDENTVSKSIRENTLVMIGDKGKSETELMFVVNYDASIKKMSFLYIPKYMKYSIDTGKYKGESDTVCTYYKKKGGEETMMMVSGLLDIGIENYIYMTFDDCKDIMDIFTMNDQGVKFNFPVSVSCAEMGISLNAGEQYFSSDMAVDLMRFYYSSNDEYDADMLKYYDGTDVKRIEMVKRYTKTFIKSQFTDKPSGNYYIENFYSLINLVISNCDTNIEASTLQSVAATLATIPSDSLYFYMLSCDRAVNSIMHLDFNDCILDIGADDSDSHVKMSAEKFLKSNFQTEG